MKLIVHRETDPKKKSEIRKAFSKECQYQAYFMLMELLSHQSGFSTSTEYLQDNLGWSTKVWEKWGKVLEERGHLFRYRQTGTNNWTFIVHEQPQAGVAAKPKKEKKEELAVPAEVIEWQEEEKKEELAVSAEVIEQVKIIPIYQPKIDDRLNFIYDTSNVKTVSVEDLLGRGT